MRLLGLGVALAGALVAGLAGAEPRKHLGTGYLLVNDAFATLYDDRWRTGSAALNIVRGTGWDGALPGQAGDIIEYRLRAEVLTPSNLVTPSATDRPYANALSLGAHTHFQLSGTDVSAGADLVFVGPQTGLSNAQNAIHDLLGLANVSNAVLAGQIDNHLYPTALLEIARPQDLGVVTLRPFIELQTGVETLARLGTDITVGQQGSLMIRDVSSGLRYAAVTGDDAGWAFNVGGDIAHVANSAFLPSPQVTLSNSRQRLRAGMRYSGKSGSVFYGISWLSPEFTTQSTGQYVGALNLHLRF